MEQQNPPSATRSYARPADRTMRAYKEFIMGVLLSLAPNAIDDKPEEWWREAWQEFWTIADEVRGRRPDDDVNQH